MLYSDDHGKTWRLGDAVATDRGADEPGLVELSDGTVLMVARSGTYLSDDGGESFRPAGERQITPRLNPSVARLAGEAAADRLLHADPRSAGMHRRGFTVWLSPDGGRSWPASRLLYPGPAAYSGMAVLSNGRIGVIYDKDDYRRGSFASVDPRSLTGK